MSLWIKLAVVLALLVGGFLAGWHWKGYADLAALKHTQDTTIAKQAKAESDMLASNKRVVDAVDALNDATEKMQERTFTELENQAHAFEAVRDQIHTTQLGDCRFSAASDRVWDSTYRALFPAAAAAAPAKGQAAH